MSTKIKTNKPDNTNSDIEALIKIEDNSNKSFNSESQEDRSSLKEEKKEEINKCKHDIEYFSKLTAKNKNEKKEKFKFCLKCNSLFVFNCNKQILQTVSDLNERVTKNYPDPYIMLKSAIDSYRKEGINFGTFYLKYRKDMISFVSKLKNKYKASLDSFYLTIRLIDSVCVNVTKFEIDLELISIACFFLACKI